MIRTKRLLFIVTVVLCALAFVACVGFGGKNSVTKRTVSDVTDWGEWVVLTEATCTEDGVEIRTSKSDASVFETRVSAAASGHDYGEWAVTLAPTCLTAGGETRVCRDCGQTDVRPILPLGHDFGEWVVTTAPTCDFAGTETRVCSHDATHVETRAIHALGHDFTDWFTVLAPTCTTTGVEKRICRNDNAHIEVRSVPKLGHDWNPWTVTLAPTCDTAGLETRVCKNDATHVETKTIPALGHDFSEWIATTPATETTDGIETRWCKHNSAHFETRVAYATGSEGLAYHFLRNSQEEYMVSAATKELKGTVYIPRFYNGKPVTMVAHSGFASCLQIEKVVFLEGSFVSVISSSAFSGCDRLKEIILPPALTIIGNNAFYRCSSLESMNIPARVEIISAALSNFSGSDYGDYYRPNSGSIMSVFRDCSGLKSITVDSANSFYKSDMNCIIERDTNRLLFALENSTIPDYVTSTASAAFYRCSFESVTIPASVETLELLAFYGCANLKDVYFLGTKEEWGVLLSVYTVDYNHTSLFQININPVIHCADGIYGE